MFSARTSAVKSGIGCCGSPIVIMIGSKPGVSPGEQFGEALKWIGARQRCAALIGGLAGSHKRSGSRYAVLLPDPIPVLVNLLLTKGGHLPITDGLRRHFRATRVRQHRDLNDQAGHPCVQKKDPISVVCFGDSLTWGFVPGKKSRYGHDVRWTPASAKGAGGRSSMSSKTASTGGRPCSKTPSGATRTVWST